MTVTHYSAHLLLLLLIALATITLGTQPVRGGASEGESTSTGGCISDWREMRNDSPVLMWRTPSLTSTPVMPLTTVC